MIFTFVFHKESAMMLLVAFRGSLALAVPCISIATTVNFDATLSVEFCGSLFSVCLDGQKLCDVEDSTFAGAGKTGLWTRSGGVIYFDDFEVVGKVKQSRAERICY
jgi:hypothetical protein